MSNDKHFDANRIFYALFILTAAEVLWGYAFGVWWDLGRPLLWSGLIGMALAKALLIAAYFMHLKFEIRPIYIVVGVPLFLTVLLIVALLPDIGFPS